MKAVSHAIAKFFNTTTLHGFKYLVSQYYCDRIGWALGCVASACCAGVLCIVLWERFLEVPALLQLRDLNVDVESQPLPVVAFCQPPEAVAETFLKHLKTDGQDTSRIPMTLAHALQGNKFEDFQADLLEKLLSFNNMTILEAFQKFSPDCLELIHNCRWRDVYVDCSRLFMKQLINLGMCCVASPTRFSKIFIPASQSFDKIKRLHVGLQASTIHGFEFLTSYSLGDTVPTRLTPGYFYFAHLTFSSEKDDDDDDEKLVDGGCISTRGYSKNQCLLKCTEKFCGCSDPLRRLAREANEIVPPPCPLRRLPCLRSLNHQGNSTSNCFCLPSCQEIIAKLVLERGAYRNMVPLCLDPIYSELNTTHSVVLQLRINMNLSKYFLLKSTETWLTLLSSLGGVFNMFLGVGLFSALEFIFFLVVKLPIALRRSSEEIAPTKDVLFEPSSKFRIYKAY